jgi:predicted DsbA family dithiol-disulfide isomerase
MPAVEVFADVCCPFAHVSIRRFVAERAARDRTDVDLVVRAWPLEKVNDGPLDAEVTAEHAEMLRDSMAPELFRHTERAQLPTSSLDAMELAAAAYEISAGVGEAVSFALRDALFEEGSDVSDPLVLEQVARKFDVPWPVDRAIALHRDWQEGQRRGVTGSPHYFCDGADFFCPPMKVETGDESTRVSFDARGFEIFIEKCLAK